MEDMARQSHSSAKQFIIGNVVVDDDDDDCRAVNNEVLDTYQLKSLDGLTEVPLEKMKICRRRGKLNLYLAEPLPSVASNVSDQHSTTAYDRLLGNDNYPMREPYDRVISCLGFKFNESLFSRYVQLNRLTTWTRMG